MSRPVRIEGAGLCYHVMARGNNRMRIFLDDLDYARLAELLGEVRERFGLNLWVQTTMPNHCHLVFQTRRPNLSAAMHRLNGMYAQWWNRRHGHVGHVYQGRFKAQIVEEYTYLLRLCRYVLNNPVRAGLAAHPLGWRWSSYRALAERRTELLDIDSLVAALDPDRSPDIIERLLEFIEGSQDHEMGDFLRRDKRVIGSDEFAKRFTRIAAAASREVPLRERRIGTPPLTAILADAVLRGEGLKGGVRDADALGYPISEIAACAGLSAPSVARLAKRAHTVARSI